MSDDLRRMAVYRAMAQATRHLNAVVEQRVQAAAGISLPELHILTALREAEGERARPGELGAMLGWEKSRISHQVTRMVARALVRRVECDEDLRGSWVELDVAGRRAEQVAAQAFGHEVAQRLAHLDDAHAADLAAELLGIALVSEPGQCDGQLTRIARQAGLDSPQRPLPA